MMQPMQGAQSNVLVVDGYNALLKVERGHLVVRSGFTSEEAREVHFPRGRCGVERIIVRAPGGTISMEAINWCAAMGIAISFVASDSSLLNCLVPDAPHDGPVKRAQAVSAVTDDAVDLARYLLAKKMDSQILAIDRDFSRLGIGNVSARSTATAQVHACKASLMETSTLVDFLALEGRAAQVYWDLLVETPLAVARMGTEADTGPLGGDLAADQWETGSSTRCHRSVQRYLELLLYAARSGDADRLRGRWTRSRPRSDPR